MEIRYPSVYSKDPEEKRQGITVKVMRLKYRLGRLSKYEIVLLESIPGWQWTDPNPKTRIEYIYKLKNDIITGNEYNKEYITKLRRFYKKGELTNDEITLCESIPEWRWNKSYTKEEVKEIMNKIRKSGKSIVSYCRENDISYPGFMCCRYRFFSDKKNKQNKRRLNRNIMLNEKQFFQWCKDNGILTDKNFKKAEKDETIPSDPKKEYGSTPWSMKSSGTYKNYISLKEFIRWCKEREIKTHKAFKERLKNGKPYNLPAAPNRIYENFSWFMLK